ncbi:hypothetical protein [Luteimicrobium subarcticum]|uniref:Uncharacterized protein n=1 Tax=Luteimicrobium subarcticum TaxID=620910 RepID=A0A2M8WR78_9MICO|nr:hypothetical protein [Luteimicrobium subarcticum]PJI93442.1 hypothetical protein CLV34_2016 [Luteimicrobium subarcticum]
MAEQPPVASRIRRTLSAYRRHSWIFAGSGVAMWVLAVVVLWAAGFPDDGFVSGLATFLMGIGLVALVVGLGALAFSLRMVRYVHRYPTQLLPVRQSFDSLGGSPILALGDDGQHPLFLVAMRQRWDLFTSLDQVLFCGRPDRRGVIATQDGQNIIWSRGPRGGARHRNWLARKVARLNAQPSADPAHPAGGRVADFWGGDQ